VAWRPGHLDRPIPDGYIETLETGENRLKDSSLALFYDKLSFVTRGELFSWDRLLTAIELSLGRYDSLLILPIGPVLRVPHEDLQEPVEQGSRWDAEGNMRIDPPGLAIVLDSLTITPHLEISLDHNDEYALLFVHDRTPLDSMLLPAANIRSGGMAIHTITLPEKVLKQGLSEIWLYPRSGDRCYSVGHIRFLDSSSDMDSTATR
jgi:arabinofuranosyltransferase